MSRAAELQANAIQPEDFATAQRAKDELQAALAAAAAVRSELASCTGTEVGGRRQVTATRGATQAQTQTAASPKQQVIAAGAHEASSPAKMWCVGGSVEALPEMEVHAEDLQIVTVHDCHTGAVAKDGRNRLTVEVTAADTDVRPTLCAVPGKNEKEMKDCFGVTVQDVAGSQGIIRVTAFGVKANGLKEIVGEIGGSAEEGVRKYLQVCLSE